MNWDAVGAVGEIVGAAAVVLSVVYLATQIRHGARTAQMAATRDLAKDIREAIAATTADATVTDIWLKGARDPSSLSPSDRHRFTGLILQSMSAYEQQFLHLREEAVHPDFYESQMLGIEGVLELPGVREIWETVARFYDAGFRGHVNALIAAKPIRALEDIEFKSE